MKAVHKTVGYQLSKRPLFVSRDLSDRRMPDVSKSFVEYVKYLKQVKKEMVVPETEALCFYAMNHMATIVRAKYLPDEPISNPDDLNILNTYSQYSGVSVSRMFYYVLIICIRESRHLHSPDKVKAHVSKKWGDKAAEFLSSIPDSASQAMEMLESNPPDITLGECASSMQYAFYNGSWSGGYRRYETWSSLWLWPCWPYVMDTRCTQAAWLVADAPDFSWLAW